MERLTKTDLRALLESIKERYPNCDLETFTQRVVSRLAKIVLADIIPDDRVNPRRRRAACAIHSHYADRSSKRILTQRRRVSRLDSSAKHATGDSIPISRKVLSRPVPNTAFPARGQLALNRENEHFQRTEPHRNPKTIQRQQKFTLIDHALHRLELGLILITSTGKIRLASACALRQIREYLGHRSLVGEPLPESLWMWVKEQEGLVRKRPDSPLPPSRLILEREGKRLVVRLASEFYRILLLREERLPATTLQSAANLSSREAQVLQWVSQGKTNKEIGAILELSPRTVQKHLEHVYQKMGVESRTGAAAKAYEIASASK